MAQPELERFESRGFCLEVELTEGVDPTPDPGVNGIRLLDGKSGTEYDKKERNTDSKYFGAKPFSVANERTFIEGNFELFCPSNPGVGNPACHLLLLIAGMTRVLDAGNKTTRYNPITTGIPSATGYWWHVDYLKKATGARANISSLKMAIGERVMGMARVTGTYQPVVEESLPDITLYETSPLVGTNKNSRAWFCVDGSFGQGEANIEVWAKSLELNFNNELGTKEYTRIKRNRITQRAATWSMRIARTDLGDIDPWELRRTNQIVSGQYRQYETSLDVAYGKYVEMGFRGQIDTIEEVDIDGDLGFDLSGPCIPTSAGGDELYVVFGDGSMTLDMDAFLVHGSAGDPYSAAPAVIGSYAEPLSFSLAGGLPGWATFDPSTGEISGATPTSGTTAIVMTVEDAEGQTFTAASVNLVIDP